jgi:ribosomal protein L37AE/L43A
MRRLAESDLTKCVKCGRICIKKYAEKQRGLCLDCHDEELKKTLGLERYKKMIQEEILEQPVLMRIEGEFYEATIIEFELYERGRCPKCGRQLTWNRELPSLFQCKPCGLIIIPSSKKSEEAAKIMGKRFGTKTIEMNAPLEGETHHFIRAR